MKKVVKIFLSGLLLIILCHCGGATEVGNPVGDLPFYQKVIGSLVIDSVEDAMVVEDYGKETGYELDLSALTITAFSTDGLIITEPVLEDMSFSLWLLIGKTYALEVFEGGHTVGEFSFAQDAQGRRANRLVINKRGPTIDLGECRLEEGVFIPQYEPPGQTGF